MRCFGLTASALSRGSEDCLPALLVLISASPPPRFTCLNPRQTAAVSWASTLPVSFRMWRGMEQWKMKAANRWGRMHTWSPAACWYSTTHRKGLDFQKVQTLVKALSGVTKENLRAHGLCCWKELSHCFYFPNCDSPQIPPQPPKLPSSYRYLDHL